jgi:hypothetical protein
MERRDYTKVFDVSRPSRTNPDPTSKPVIVGHQPMMADPMVRPISVHSDPEAGFDSTPHHAKVIEVSSEIRGHIAQSQPPSPADLAATAAEENTAGVIVPEPATPSALEPIAPPAAVQPQQSVPPPAAAPIAEMTPSMPALPIQQPVSAPPPEPDLTSIQHVPVSHMPASPTGRLKKVGLWLFVAVILVGFGLYLAIDAGFIQAGFNLPFHIFSRQG